MKESQILNLKSQRFDAKEQKMLGIFVLSFLVLSSWFLATTAYASTGINKTINFQGKLSKSDGTNVNNGTYSVVFTLYDASSGGTNLWTETQSVTTSNGIFQVALGSVNSLAGVNFNSDTIYLGIKVGSDSEMTPRIRFAAVPYALNADKLDGVVATQSATGFTLTGGSSTPKTLTLNDDITLGLTITPSSSNGLTILSNGANTLRLDSGASGTMLIGDTNATTITFGKSGGGITLPGFATNQNSVLYTGTSGALGAATTTTAGLCLVSAANTPGWANCPSNPTWNVSSSNGVLYPGNTTLDVLLGGVSTASAKFSFLNMAGGTPTASLSAGVSGGLSLSASGTITTTANQSLILGNSTSGHIILNPLARMYVGVGTTAPAATLDVRGTTGLNGGTVPVATLSGQTSFAALVVNNSGRGDLFAASSSGFTRFVIGQTGNIQFAGNTNVLTTLTSAATAAQTITLPNATGIVCLSTNNCSFAGGTNYFQSVSPGTITPYISTVDLLVGGVATNSGTTLGSYARAAFLNMAGGTPTASLSAGLAGGSYLSATGTLATTAKQTLTLGDTNTGNIVLNNFGTGIIHSTSGVLSASAVNLANGDVSGILGIANGGSPFEQTNNGAITERITTQDLLLGATSTASAKFAFINVAGGTPVASLSAGLAGGAYLSANGVIQTTSNQSLTLGGSTTGNIILNPLAGNYLGIGTSNPLASLDLRATTGLNGGTVAIASVSGKTSFAGLVVDNGGVGSIFTASHAGVPTFTINNTGQILTSNYQVAGGVIYTNNTGVFLQTAQGGAGTVLHGGAGTPSFSAVSLTADVTGTLGVGNGGTGQGSFNNGALLYGAGSTTALNSLAIGGTNTCLISTGTAPSWSNCALGTNYWQSVNPGTITPYISTADLLVGGVATNSGTTLGSYARAAFLNMAGGTPVASLSAGLAGGSYLSATGTLATTAKQTLTLGDTNTGNIVLNNFVSGIIHSTSGVLSASAVNLANGDVAGILGIANGGSPFEQTNNGAITERIITQDLLIGGISTSSAKFTVINVAGGTPTASLSAGLAGGAYLTATGVLQTTNNQTLTFGGTTTGNILMNPQGQNYVGIGTFSPLAALDVRTSVNTIATASISANSTFAAIVVDNSGSGDIFTASSSGLKRFAINNNGSIDLDSVTYAGCSVLATDASGNLYCSSSGAKETIASVYTIATPAGANLHITFTGAANSAPSSSSGTIVFPANATKLSIQLKGAGGGSGGLASGNANKTSGGGGEGGYSQKMITSMASDYYIKVGGGGAGGATGNNNGAQGTATCFGTNSSDACTSPLSSATGGAGTVGNAGTSVQELGGAGGVGANGDLNLTGQPGGATTVATSGIVSGYGGGISGGAAIIANGSGNPGSNGGGAGGALNTASSGTTAGSKGGDGYITIIIYTNSSTVNTGDGWLQYASGVLAPMSSSTDVLIGSNATASAKFGFLNVLAGTPTASISAGLAGGAYLTAAGVLQTTNNQTLTLGGTTTGNIILNPAAGNYVGIDTQNPFATLDVHAALSLNGGTLAIASLSGTTSFAGLVVNNSGRGDLFTASSSGQNRFVIKQNGNVNIGTQSAAIAPYKLYVSDYQPATAAAMIENTAKTGRPLAACATGQQCQTGLIVRLGQPGDAGTPGTGDFFISFQNGKGNRAGAIRGNGGAGVQYDTGGADYAEYFTVDPLVLPANYTDEERDQVFSAGTLICQGDNGVVPCGTIHAKGLLGIISNNSGFVGAQEGPDKVLVGLTGQVTVKVSTINGTVKNGDPLAASSIPGVAVKATKAGEIIGRALEDYNSSDPNNVGSITTTVKESWYDPDIALLTLDGLQITHSTSSSSAFTLVDAGGQAINRVGAFAEAAVGNIQIGAGVAQHMTIDGYLNVKDNITAGILTVGDITTNSLTVTTENISIGGQTLRDYIASIVIDVLNKQAKTQQTNSTTAVAGLDLVEAGITNHESRIKDLETILASSSAVLGESTVATESAEALDTHGTLDTRGTLALDSLNVDGLATVSSTLRVKQNGLIEGMLTVIDTVMTKNLVVSGLATFFNDVVFTGPVSFNTPPTFSKDTAGFAIIKKDSDRVEVVFDKPYQNTPIVNVSISLDETPTPTPDPTSISEPKDPNEVLSQKVLANEVSYIVTKRTTKGFTILLNKSADEDIPFSWTALVVDDPHTFESKPTISPTPTIPVSSPSPAGGNSNREEVIINEGTH